MSNNAPNVTQSDNNDPYGPWAGPDPADYTPAPPAHVCKAKTSFWAKVCHVLGVVSFVIVMIAFAPPVLKSISIPGSVWAIIGACLVCIAGTAGFMFYLFGRKD